MKGISNQREKMIQVSYVRCTNNFTLSLCYTNEVVCVCVWAWACQDLAFSSLTLAWVKSSPSLERKYRTAWEKPSSGMEIESSLSLSLALRAVLVVKFNVLVLEWWVQLVPNTPLQLNTEEGRNERQENIERGERGKQMRNVEGGEMDIWFHVRWLFPQLSG